MVKRAPYFPECWDDDTEMRGLMSMLKDRHVNPVNFDRTVEFWRRVIENYCTYHKKCIVDFDELREQFRRGNQLPGPLLTVFEELHKKQVLVPVDELVSPRQSWLQWGTSIVKSSFLMGTSVDFKQIGIVHIPTLKKLAKEMLAFYKAEYDSVDCSEVVGYDEFKARCRNVCEAHSFDAVLEELMRQGEVSEGKSSDGDRILKFKDQRETGPAKFTQADASVHELRRTMCRLENETKRVEQKVKAFAQEARDAVHRGDKTSAMAALRKKKRAEKELSDKDTQYQRLLQMLEQLATSKQTREIIDVYKTGTQAYKNALARQGLTAEKIDETMDTIHEAMQDANDVDEALREGIRAIPTPSNYVDDSVLEEELKSILEEDRKAKEPRVPSLPEVPQHRLAGTSKDDDVAARLRRLREGMHA